MTAVELVREILSSDNEDWKNWAYSFATPQGDKPYTVANLLEKVVNQDKLLNACTMQVARKRRPQGEYPKDGYMAVG